VLITSIEDFDQDRLTEYGLDWVGTGEHRHIAYWRHDSDGHGTLLYDLDAGELDELNTMIGNAASKDEILAWLNEQADEFLWDDDMERGS
jgi:hypothetical protein